MLETQRVNVANRRVTSFTCYAMQKPKPDQNMNGCNITGYGVSLQKMTVILRMDQWKGMDDLELVNSCMRGR